MLCLWVSCASPWGSPDRRSAPRVLLGKSGWGWSGWECVPRVIRRCVPRVGRGPYTRFYLSLIVCSIGFSSLGHHPMFFISLFYVHLVSNFWDTILGSFLIYSLFILFISLGRHPRICISLIVCSFGLSSLWHPPCFYLGFFFVPLVSHHWDSILCSILVYYFFVWFFIIGASSLVLSNLNHLFLQLLNIRTPSLVWF